MSSTSPIHASHRAGRRSKARLVLEEIGVDLGELKPQPRAQWEPMISVPAPSASASDADWLDRHLKRALSSARDEGERLIGTIDVLAKRLAPDATDNVAAHESTPSPNSAFDITAQALSLFDVDFNEAGRAALPERARALLLVARARAGVQSAWADLVAGLEEAIKSATLATSVSALLDGFYRVAVAALQPLRDDSTWHALWPEPDVAEFQSDVEICERDGSARADAFNIQTSQEMDVLLRSICDGRHGTHWKTSVQADARVYERPDMSHSVRLQLQDEEKRAGLGVDVLERLTLAQDADAVFSILYVSRLLAPPGPLPPNLRAGAWVSADDIIEKIGWDPRSTEERQIMRRRVWDYLKFGARASVTGRRSSKYRDPRSGEEIDTFIDGPAWAFLKEEKPVQPSLFAEEDVPLRVELVMSREWTRFTSSPLFAQYLPLGEVLGAIRPDKPSGAWARVLGLALASFWRRQPRATLDGTLLPTRRELLDHYPPKVAPPLEVLQGQQPRRAITYWCSALRILAEADFIALSGEATRKDSDIKAALPRYDWRDIWLDERVALAPGDAMRDSVQASANALPIARPRQLQKAPKKRGRPRKNPASTEN